MMPSAAAPSGFPHVVIGLNAVIVAVTAEEPRILTVTRTVHPFAMPAELNVWETSEQASDALPFGPLEPERHLTLERGLRSWVEQQTGLQLGYVEQLYTFGDRFRGVGDRDGMPWVISVAYLALVREQDVASSSEARWRDWYSAFPWEDWRTGRPALIEQTIQPALQTWCAAALTAEVERSRRERVEITFGLHGAPWDPERALERYELLYEAALVEEPYRSTVSQPGPREKGVSRTSTDRMDREALAASVQDTMSRNLGRPMALDHRRILATALGRVRGKIKYRPVVFELLPRTFTLWQLQRVVEALSGIRLHKQNFRRLVERGGLVEATGQSDLSTGGRPAALFRFRREVLRERAASGVGLPGVPTGT